MIILKIFALMAVFICYALCAVGGKSDERIEEEK